MASEVNRQLCFTAALVAAYEITDAKKIVAITIKVISGTCTLEGSDKIDGVESQAIALSAGDVVTISATGASVLDGITITPSGGTTNLIAQR